MRVAAIEFTDKGIRVNSIHPGPVNNRMIKDIEKQISPGEPTKAKKDFKIPQYGTDMLKTKK